MRQLLRKIFPPYEVSLTLKEAKAFFDQSGSFLCRPIIEPAVVALIKAADRTIYSIRIDGKRPDHLALLLVTNVVGAHLQSGQHHTYRAMLSIVGADMLKLWHEAQAQLLERGYCSEAEVAEDNEWIKTQIKDVG